MDNVMQRAQQRGQIRTLLGRLCRFHLWEPNMFGMHKAMTHDERSWNMDQGLEELILTKH